MVVDEDHDDATQQNRDEYHDVVEKAHYNDEDEDEDQNVEEEEDNANDEEDDNNEDDDEEEDIFKIMEAVSYPDDVSKDDLIKNLTDDCLINYLICDFNDDVNWDDTKDLQCTLLGHRDKIEDFSFGSRYYENQDRGKQCFNFFLEFLTKDPE